MGCGDDLTAGAALVALEHLPVPAVTDTSAARRRRGQHLRRRSRARCPRVAADLAAAGCVGPIPDLALTASELHWWSALALIRSSSSTTPSSTSPRCPDDAYPDAAGLLVWCTSAPIAARSAAGAHAVDDACTGRVWLGARSRVGGRRAHRRGDRVADRPAAAEAIATLRPSSRLPRSMLLRALHGGGDPSTRRCASRGARRCRSWTTWSTAAIRVDDESLAAVKPDEARYLVARTHPSS
jgi:hypothetical protein